MLRFGPAGYPPGSKNAEQAIDTVASLGLQALEMQFVRGVRLDHVRAQVIGEHARAAGVRLSAHAPYYVNFNSSNPETRERSVDWVLDTVRVCHHLRASPVVIHAASYGKNEAECTAAVISGLQRCLEIMEVERISDVRIGLETMGKKASWGTMDEIAEVTAVLPGTMPVLDLAHIHARDGGILTSADQVRGLLAQGASMADGPLHLHVSGIEFGERGERKHLPLSSGQPDMSILIEPLIEARQDVTVIVESPLQEQDALWLQGLLQR